MRDCQLLHTLLTIVFHLCVLSCTFGCGVADHNPGGMRAESSLQSALHLRAARLLLLRTPHSCDMRPSRPLQPSNCRQRRWKLLQCSLWALRPPPVTGMSPPPLTLWGLVADKHCARQMRGAHWHTSRRALQLLQQLAALRLTSWQRNRLEPEAFLALKEGRNLWRQCRATRCVSYLLGCCLPCWHVVFVSHHPADRHRTGGPGHQCTGQGVPALDRIVGFCDGM